MKSRARFHRPGMALVVAIMTAFILLALLTSLFLVVATTRRQADYSRNAAIALNLAEAGVADALYRLNYCVSPAGDYPFSDSANPFAGVSWLIPSDPGHPEVSFPEHTLVAPVEWVYGELGGGSYYACAAGTPERPVLISAGLYNNTWRTLSVDLRGKVVTPPPQNRQEAETAVSEAFNKKAAYARYFAVLNFNTVPVSGNITAVDFTGTGFLSGDRTVTRVVEDNFQAPVFGERAFPGLPAFPAPDVRFRDGDPATGYQAAAGCADIYSPPYLGIISYADGNIYTVTGGIAGQVWQFEGVAPPPEVAVSGTASVIVAANDGNITVAPNSAAAADLFARGSLTVGSSAGVGGRVIAQGDVMVNPGATVTGGVFAGQVATLNAAGGPPITVGSTGYSAGDNNRVRGREVRLETASVADQIIVNGALAGGDLVSITGDGQVSVLAGSNDLPAAIFTRQAVHIYPSAVPLAVTLGEQQDAAILALGLAAGGSVAVHLARPFNPTCEAPDQAAIVAQAPGTDPADTALVDITGTAAVGAADNGRLVFAFSAGVGGGGTINVDIPGLTLYGCLVTNGTVNFVQGALVYDPAPFIGAGVDYGADIYRGFTGGRRVYLPRPAGWRLFGR